MRFVSVGNHGRVRLGVVEDDMVSILPETLGDLADVVIAGAEGMARVRAALASSDLPRTALSEVELLAPLNRFRRDVLCTGWNYHAHFEESVGKSGGQEV